MLFTFRSNDNRIDEFNQIWFIFFRNICFENKNNSSQNPDLRSGKSDAVRVVHGLSHILKENVQLFIEFYDRTAFFVEYLVAVLYNVSECHIYPFLIFMSSILAIRLKRHYIIYAVQHTSAFMSA